MALPASGQISASQISEEFGRNKEGNAMSLGDYRLTQTVGSLTLDGIDTNIPSSGEIKFSDFYNARLNVVVDFHSGGTEFRQNAKTRYNNGNVTVIGGFREKKEAGSKVLIHVNKTLGSQKHHINSNLVALRTGNWDSDVILSVDIGSSGAIYGAGGDGGSGADCENTTSSLAEDLIGLNGTSALGIEHEETAVNLFPGGKLFCGFAGGGGGGGARQVDGGEAEDRRACGGGGGGGSGLPAGSGGRGGVQVINGVQQLNGSSNNNFAFGNAGGDATLEENGEGGAGGDNKNSEAVGGTGGKGGDVGFALGEIAQPGSAGALGPGVGGGAYFELENHPDGPHGRAGFDGAAIRRTNGGIDVDFNQLGGLFLGATNATGVE